MVGILLGPVTGVVPAGEHLGLFFDVGVVLLFFLVGVDEIDIAGFIRTIKKRLFIAAVVAFAIPLAIGVPVIYYVLGHHMATAIALSGILALSSLGVAARVLGDLGQLKRPIGLEIFTVVVLVEVAGLLVVAFTIEELEHTEHVNQFHPVQAAILVGQIAVFSIVAWFLGSRVFVPVVTRLRQFLAAPQLSFGLFLGALFLIVVAAEQIGLHGSLGALLLGAALSQLPHRLRFEVLPGLRSAALGFFVPLFFASAGLHLNASFLHLPPTTIGVVIGLAVGAKLAGSMLAPRLAGLDWPGSIGWGLMAKGAVEVALLLVLLELNAITEELFSLLTIVMLAFILIVPKLMERSLRKKHEAEPADTLGMLVPPPYARYVLDDKVVGDAFNPSTAVPYASLSLESFFRFWMTPGQMDYVVRDLAGKPAGVLSLKKVKEVSTGQWAATSLDSLLIVQFPTVSPDEPIDDALEKMVERRLPPSPWWTSTLETCWANSPPRMFTPSCWRVSRLNRGSHGGGSVPWTPAIAGITGRAAAATPACCSLAAAPSTIRVRSEVGSSPGSFPVLLQTALRTCCSPNPWDAPRPRSAFRSDGARACSAPDAGANVSLSPYNEFPN